MKINYDIRDKPQNICRCMIAQGKEVSHIGNRSYNRHNDQIIFMAQKKDWSMLMDSPGVLADVHGPNNVSVVIII